MDGALIFFIIWICIAFIVFKRVTKVIDLKKGNSDVIDKIILNKTSGTNRVVDKKVSQKRKAIYNDVVRDHKSISLSNSSVLHDDRNNDWLAKQLSEENRARSYLSEMFQMKMNHMNSCDAEFIKRFHEQNCDAGGIDNGIGK